MTVISVIALILGVIALFMTFRAKFVLEKILHREATEKAVLRVKYAALGVAVAAFFAAFLLD